MKARLCIQTVDGSIFRSAYDKEIFDNKLRIVMDLGEIKNLNHMALTIDGVERFFNPDNIVSFWMEDEK